MNRNDKLLKQLINYAKSFLYLSDEDECYSINKLIEFFNLDGYEDVQVEDVEFEQLKEEIISYSKERGILVNEGTSFSDELIAKVMDILMPKPSTLRQMFKDWYKVSSENATNKYYAFSESSDYIKTQRLKNNIIWQDKLVMTINIAKPEKTTKEIELAAKRAATAYPKCAICKQTEGASARFGAERQNHRIIDLKLNSQTYYFQYSPYAYFPEHCIVLHDEHVPMKIDENSIKVMLDFVDQFEHYMISSNADLPLVGGSILSHDHFQGGKMVFPLELADVVYTRELGNTKLSIIDWPMSTVSVESSSREEVYSYSKKIIELWREYNNKEIGIISATDDIHNSCNLFVRKSDGNYRVIVVLRNNRRDDENPDGIFHTNKKYWHLKQENIGIIEVLGLAILPGRLKDDLYLMKEYLDNGNFDQSIEKHREWLDEIKGEYDGNFKEFIELKMQDRFYKVLECCAVFKKNDQKHFERFLETI